MNAPFILLIGAVALITASPSLLFLVLLMAGIVSLAIKSTNKQASIQQPISQLDTDFNKNTLPLNSQQNIVEKPIATKANKKQGVKPEKKPKPRIDKSESASAKSDEPSAKDSSLVYKTKRFNTSEEFNFNSVSGNGPAKKNLENNFVANLLDVSRNNYPGNRVRVSDILYTLIENQSQSSSDTLLGSKDFRAYYGIGGLGASSSYPRLEKCNNNRRNNRRMRMRKVKSVKQGDSQEIQDIDSESPSHH